MTEGFKNRGDIYLHRIEQLEQALQVARTNAAHWRGRHDALQKNMPTAHQHIVLEPAHDTMLGLNREATLRHVKPAALAEQIVAMVVRDKLFTAVLDQ